MSGDSAAQSTERLTERLQAAVDVYRPGREAAGRPADPEAALRGMGEIAITSLRVPERPGVAFRASMMIQGAPMTLDLQPYSVRAPGFTLELRRAGRSQILDPGPVRTLRGSIREIPGSLVVGTLWEHGLEAALQLPDETTLWLEPVAKRLPGAAKSLYDISRCGDEAAGAAGEAAGVACGVTRRRAVPDLEKGMALSKLSGNANCATQGGCLAHILIDTDSAFYAANSSSSAQATATAESLIALVNPRYEQPFNITHRISHLVLRADAASDPYASALITSAVDMLSEVAFEWPARPSGKDVDLIHLLSGRSFGGVGGRANIGGVCTLGGVNGMYGYSSVTASNCNTAGVVIHELGHSWGSDHACGIMAPFTSSCTTPWCGSSLTSIPTNRDRVAGICLDLANQPPVASFTYNCTGLSCVFDAGGSTDDHGIVSYAWSFGDSISGTGVSPTHVYSASSSYLVTLTVTDANGASAALTQNAILIFADVPPGHWARSFIESLYNHGITGGCGLTPRRYCPDTNITRADTAVFLLRGKEGGGYVPPACTTPTFGDVPCGHEAARWVNELARRGITAGCGGGNYCPTALVNRGTMAFFLLTTLGIPTPTTCTGMFSDVPCGDWYAPWVEELARRGISGGCGGGKFCPADRVTRAQMAVFLVTTFGIPVP